MKLCEWLYIKTQISKENFTDIPTGQISIEEYLQGHSKFFIDEQSKIFTPKKIILGKINLKEMSISEFFKYILMLNTLILDYQFEVYHLQNGFLKYTELRELSNNLFRVENDSNFDDISLPIHFKELLNSFFEKDKEYIQQCVVDNHLQGKVCIIDTLHAKELAKQFDQKLLDKISPPSQLSPIIFYNLIFLMQYWVNESQFSCNDFHLIDKELNDIFEAHQSYFFSKTMEQISELDTRVKYLLCTKDMNIKEISSELRRNKPFELSMSSASIEKLNALKLYECHFLKRLRLDFLVDTFTTVSQLLSNLPPKINELILEDLKLINGRNGCKEEIAVDSLSLIWAKTDMNSLSKMLNSMSSIRHMKLWCLQVFSADENHLNLKNLKHLEIYGYLTLIPDVFLRQLLESPALEYLFIEIDLDLFFKAIENISQLPNLKVIHFGIKPLSTEKIEILKAKAPLLVDCVYNKDIAPNNITSHTKPDNQTIQDIHHNYENYYHHRPQPSEYKFQNLQNYSQGMVIDKFCQYQKLIEHGLNNEQLILLQEGICSALCEFFKLKKYEQIKQFLNSARQWDGSNPISTDLQKEFDELSSIITKFHIQKEPSSYPLLYIGHELEKLVEKSDMIILKNPWHAILVQKHQQTWYIYDPNYLDGPRPINQKKELLQSINQSLGTLIFVENDFRYEAGPIQIPNINLFLEHGGILALISMNQNQQQEVMDWMRTQEDLSEKSLYKSLQIINVNNKKTQDIINFYPKLKDFLRQNYLKDSTYIPLYDYLAEDQKLENHIAPLPLLKNLSLHRDALKTWKFKQDLTQKDAKAFILNILSEASKTLIRVDSEKTLNGLRDGLQKIAQDTHRNLFYAHKAHDLQLIVKRFKINELGNIVVEKNSSFADFLNNEQEEKIILINYDHFTAEEIVAFNELLDKQAKINGQSISVNSDTPPLNERIHSSGGFL